MRDRTITVLAGISVAVLLMSSGCMVTALERNWGSSYESAMTNQQMNPDASKNMDPVWDFDGQAAANNVGEYRQSFGQTGNKTTSAQSPVKSIMELLGTKSAP